MELLMEFNDDYGMWKGPIVRTGGGKGKYMLMLWSDQSPDNDQE